MCMAILIFTIFYHGIGFSFLCLHNYIATKNLKEPLKCICNMHIRTCNLGVPYIQSVPIFGIITSPITYKALSKGYSQELLKSSFIISHQYTMTFWQFSIFRLCFQDVNVYGVYVTAFFKNKVLSLVHYLNLWKP